MKKIITIMLMLFSFSAWAQSESIPGHGVGNGGDEIRRVFIETGLKVLDFLASTQEGQKLLADFSLDLNKLCGGLNIQNIKVGRAKEDDLDNGGSRVDSVMKDGKLWLIQERWDVLLRSNRPLHNHVFHELLRLADYNDDDYKISGKLPPLSNLNDLKRHAPPTKQEKTDLEVKRSKLKEQIAAFSSLKNRIDRLNQKVKAFAFAGDMNAKYVHSSNPNVAVGVATLSANPATIEFEIVRLATNEVQELKFSSIYDPVTKVDGQFVLTVRGVTHTIQVAALTTLVQLADQINQANLGISVTAYNTGSGGANPARLSISDNKSGQYAPNNDDWRANIEFSSETRLTELKVEKFTVLSKGLDSLIRLHGNRVYRDSNILSDVIPGLTITLLTKSSEPVVLTVRVSNSQSLQKIKSFVEEYNSTVKEIQTALTFDDPRATITATAGNPLLVDILWKIQTTITKRIKPLSSVSKVVSLPDFGIRLSPGFRDEKPGYLTLDEQKLDLMLSEHAKDLQIFFEGQNEIAGFAQSFSEILDEIKQSISRRMSLLMLQIHQIDSQIP